MKRISTLACTVLSIVLSISNYHSAKAQCTAPAMSWKNVSLVSGTAGQVNAVYKFPSVTPGVNAFVTLIAKVSGSTLTSVDDLTYGYSAAWQPVVKTPSTQVAADAYISFKIEFKDSIDNKAHQYPCFQLSFIDIDGNGEHIREFVATKDFDSYTVSGNTSLTITQTGGGGFTQATGALPDYAGLDTSAYNTNINFRFINKDKVNEVRIGTRVDATHDFKNRYSCGYFANITMPNGGTLPVNYLSFDAVVNDKSVLLKWTTTQEVNNSHFEVERSLDMNTYKTIGLALDGFPVNGTGKSYQFKDLTSELDGKPVAYYRLKQIDLDGKATYSKVLAVRLQVKTDVAMQVSPNPFAENLNVRFNATENGTAQIRIINNQGQTLLSKQSAISKGYNNIQVDGLNGLAAGLYIAQLVMNGTVIDNQRVIRN